MAMSPRSKTFSQMRALEFGRPCPAGRWRAAPGSTCRLVAQAISGAAMKATHERDEWREDLRVLAERAHEREARQQHRDDQRAHAHGIDVVEVRALELDVLRAEAQRLVDDQVRGERAYPPGREVGVDDQDALDGAEDADLHEQQRQHHVEHQPHDAPGMRVRQAREEVRPGDRARVGVRHVDLELADDDEDAGQHQRERRRLEHLAEGDGDT